MKIRASAIVLTLAGVIAVWVLCLTPTTPGSTLYSDKIQHLSAYFLQVACMGILFPRHRLWVILGFIAQGAIIEGLQSLTRYRSAEWADMLANTIGVFIGLAFIVSPFGRWFSRQLYPFAASSK